MTACGELTVYGWYIYIVLLLSCLADVNVEGGAVGVSESDVPSQGLPTLPSSVSLTAAEHAVHQAVQLVMTQVSGYLTVTCI